jgi:hypothetical protein
MGGSSGLKLAAWLCSACTLALIPCHLYFTLSYYISSFYIVSSVLSICLFVYLSLAPVIPSEACFLQFLSGVFSVFSVGWGSHELGPCFTKSLGTLDHDNSGGHSIVTSHDFDILFGGATTSATCVVG